MIKLFKNIENYKELSLKDMAVVAKNYVYFVPRDKADEYSKKVMPLVTEAHTKVRKYFSLFNSERKELSSIIEKYFDRKYFEEQKKSLENNMFDVNYALKRLLNKMSVKQLSDFGCSLMMAHMKSDLFMTEDNYYGFTWDLSVETDTAMKGGAFSKLDKVPKERLIEIYLKYIDLNIILADNAAEAILGGATVDEAVQFIFNVENMKHKLYYRETILM